MNRILLALLLLAAVPARAANSCSEVTRPTPVTCAFGEVLTRDPLGLRCVVLASTVTQMAWEAITNKPVDYHPSSHTHSVTALETTGTPSSSTVLYGDGVWRAAPLGGGGSGGPVAWTDVTGKPSAFTPTTHTHAGTDVTGTVASATNATTATTASAAPWAGVTGKPSTFAPSGHTHDAVDLTSGTLPSPRLPAATSTARGAVVVPAAACDVTTQKAVWNGTAFACVTDQTGGTYTLPAAAASVLGGVKSLSCANGYVLTGINTSGSPVCTAIGAVLASIVTVDGNPPADTSQTYWIDASTGSTPTASAPAFSPVAGAVANGSTITASSSTSGATLYLDAFSPPTTARSTATVSGAATWYAQAKKAGYTDSSISSAAYTLTDTTAPTITAFTMPGTAASLTVNVSSFTATDAVGVTGYQITTSASAPAAGGAGWTGSAPATATASSAGAVTWRAWAKDAAGNVSSASTASTTITLADTTAPTVTAFTLSTPTGLVVPVTALTATDGVGVTAYVVSEGACPAAGAGGWVGTAPADYTFGSAGTYTLRGCAKDAAGNVSTGLTAGVTVAPLAAATPTFSPVAGNVASGTSVTISTATGGCSGYIYWNTTGSPTTSDTHTTSATVSAAETVYAKVIGCPGYADSAVGSAAYTVLTMYTDTFSADSGALYSNSGTVNHSVSGGKLEVYKSAEDGANGVVYRNDTGTFADGSIQATINSNAATQDKGVILRYADVNNFLLLYWNTGGFQIFKRVSGTFTSLGSWTFANDGMTDRILLFQVVGDHAKGYVDGTLRIDVASGLGVSAAGLAGFLVGPADTIHHVAVDNLTITKGAVF